MQMNCLRPRVTGTGVNGASSGIAAHLTAQSWVESGSNIYSTGGNTGIGTTTRSIPFQVSGAGPGFAPRNLSASSEQLALNSSSGIRNGTASVHGDRRFVLFSEQKA
jgi:hypothetical protein